MGLYKEGWLDDAVGQARVSVDLAPLYLDKRFDAEEGVATRAIDLFPQKGQEFRVRESHRPS